MIVTGREGIQLSTAAVSYRRTDDLSEVSRRWGAVGIEKFAPADPRRTEDRNGSGHGITDSTGLHHREVKAINRSVEGVLACIITVVPAPAEVAVDDDRRNRRPMGRR